MKSVLIGIFSILASGVLASTANVNGIWWTYSAKNGTASIYAEYAGYTPAISKETAGEIIIPDMINGNVVIGIGGYAFYGCEKLTKIQIPSSITNIASYAFEGCVGLTEIIIPDTVTRIQKGVFKDCYSLTSIEIPNGVTSIESAAFEGCSGLTSVLIPNSVRTIGGGVFSSCRGLKSIVLPFVGRCRGNSDSTEDLFGYVFGSSYYDGCVPIVQPCNSTVTVSPTSPDCRTYCIPSSLKSVVITDEPLVADCAFYDCGMLDSVTLCDGVTNIGTSAFFNCSGLTNVVMPSSVLNINSSAFSGCSGLSKVSIPDGVLRVGAGAFSGCSGLSKVSIPDSVLRIGAGAFSGCSGLTEIVVPFVGTQKENYVSSDWLFGSIFGNSEYPGGRKTTQYYSPNRAVVYYVPSSLSRVIITKESELRYGAFYDCADLTSITIATTVSNIDSNVFSGCVGLREVAVPQCVCSSRLSSVFADSYQSITNIIISDGVVSVGDNAFSGCGSLTHVYMSDDVERIGNFAFSECSELSEFRIGNGVKEIGREVFRGCRNLKSFEVDAGSSNLKATNGILLSKDGAELIASPWGMSDVTIPDGVVQIGDYAFYNYTELTNVALCTGLRNVGEHAFHGCNNLESIVLSNGLSSIQDYAFYNCIGLKAVVFGAGLSHVGNYAFSGCSSLERVELPEGMLDLGNYAYNDCSAISYVSIPSSVTNVGSSAFMGCNSVRGVSVPQCINSMAATLPDAYRSLNAATIDDGVTNVFSRLFSGCIGLAEVTIPSSVAAIGEDAFLGCSNLSRINIFDLGAWVQMLSNNAVGASYDLYLNGMRVQRVTIPDHIESVPKWGFAGCASLEEVIFPVGLKMIGKGAFSECNNLSKVTLPLRPMCLGDLDLRPIEVEAATVVNGFRVCNGWLLGYANNAVSYLEIPDGIVGIAPYALSDFWDLEEVVLPESLKYIGYGAFMNDTYLDNVIIPDGVEYIDDEAFSGCTYLRDIVIGAGVKEIGNGAFRNCTQITTLTLPDGVESIGDGAFSNCWRMLSVKLPLGLSKIGTGMFEKCSSLVGASVQSDTFTMNELFGDRSSKLVSVSIIDGSAQICTNAFAGCSALESVEMPQGITNIQSGAFRNCVKLSDVSLPETVEHLGAQAFYGCSILAGIVLPDSVEVIDAEVFRNCSSLRNVTLSRNLRALPDYAFYGCRSLVSMVVSASVADIGSYISNYLTALYFLGNAPGYSPNAYSSTPSSMKTYVVQGSRGWDGIPSSRDMPETWIGRAITYWTPNRFNAIFDSNGGSFPNEALTYACEQITDTSYAIPPFEPTRIGYAFAGWWTDRTDGAQIKATTCVNETRETTFYAHWKLMYAPVTVRFNANGGVVVPDEAEYFAGLTYGDFPVPTKEHYQFAGWFTTPDGGNVVAVSDEVPAAGAELYAHWMPETYYIRYNSNGGNGTMADQSFQYGDNIVLRANTFSKANSNFIGWGVDPEGPVVYPDKKQISTLGAVQGGVINLYAQWSAAKYAVRYDSNGGVGTMDSDTFTVDVGQPLSPNLFTRQGYIFIGWSKSADATAAEYEDCEVVKNLTGNTNAAVALFAVWARNTSNVSISCEGDAPWHPAKFTRNGEVVWQSGVIGDGETTVAQSLIAGRGTLSFDWSASCEESFRGMRLDYLVFIVDGTEVGFVNGNTDWDAVSCTIDSDGEHVIEWRYVKDSAGAAYDDCGRVTSVCWTPSLNTLSDFANAVGLSLVSDSESKWFGETAVSYDGISAIQSGPISDGECSSVECTVWGQGQLSFWWKVSCEEPFRGLPLDYASFAVDEIEQCWIAGNADWTNVVVVLEGAGQHKLTWTYRKDAWANTSAGLDCAWLDAVTWTPSGAAEGLAVEVNGAAVEFETAADGKTRTAAVAVGTAAEDVKVFVGGVDVTAGFKVAVEGTTATVVLKEPYETARLESAPYQAWTDNGDGNVTLNVEVVPGLYYAADSAATIEALRRPGAAEPAKAGDAVVAPKQMGAQGFYKVWVSDAPIKAE